jgi:hypothetical protein
MVPFSMNASTLFGEAIKVNRPFQWKYLKAYTSIPEFESAEVRAAPLIKALKGVVYYSNQVVAISNARMTDKDKNRHLARYLFEALQKTAVKEQLDSLGLERVPIEAVLENIRQSDTYMDGIGAANPLISEIVVAIQIRLDELQADIPEIIAGKT